MKLSTKQEKALIAIRRALPVPLVIAGWIDTGRVHAGLHSASVTALQSRGLIKVITVWSPKPDDATSLTVAWLTPEGMKASQ